LMLDPSPLDPAMLGCWTMNAWFAVIGIANALLGLHIDDILALDS